MTSPSSQPSDDCASATQVQPWRCCCPEPEEKKTNSTSLISMRIKLIDKITPKKIKCQNKPEISPSLGRNPAAIAWRCCHMAASCRLSRFALRPACNPPIAAGRLFMVDVQLHCKFWSSGPGHDCQRINPSPGEKDNPRTKSSDPTDRPCRQL